MRYASFIMLMLLLGTTAAQAQMTIRKAEPASNSVRSLSSNDLIREEIDAQIVATEKKITDLQEQLKQTTEALTAVNERLAIAEGTLQQTTACAAEGRIFNGSICTDLGLSSPMFVGKSSTSDFVAPEAFSETTAADVIAPVSTLPPTLEDIIPSPEETTIGGSAPAEADLDSILAE